VSQVVCLHTSQATWYVAEDGRAHVKDAQAQTQHSGKHKTLDVYQQLVPVAEAGRETAQQNVVVVFAR
jgi:hypothetical protein